MHFEGHSGGASRLAELEVIASDDKVDPCHRAFALVLISIVSVAKLERAEVEVLARNSGEATWDEAQAVSINGVIFDIVLNKQMGRTGRAKARIEVMVSRNNSWLRLTTHGAFIAEDSPSWEDTTKSWHLRDNEMDMVAEFARDIARVVMECGMFHARELGGCMPKCDSCSYQFTCMAAPRYLIRHT